MLVADSISSPAGNPFHVIMDSFSKSEWIFSEMESRSAPSAFQSFNNSLARASI